MKLDFNKSLSRFSSLLKYETVAENIDEIARFKEALRELYPNIARECEFTQVGNLNKGSGGMIYKYKGKTSIGSPLISEGGNVTPDSAKSIVLMAHYDVVPASPEQWDKHPFLGEFDDNMVWGRGAIDTKCTLCAVMESVEVLIEKGFTPDYDVYMCFGGDEETTGNDAVAIASKLREWGVKPFLVLDEGGAVVDGGSIGLGKLCAMVGIAEKGYMDVEFIAKGKGGHTSLPVEYNPITTMSEVIRRLEKPFKPMISEAVMIMRTAIAKHANFKIKLALTSPLLQKILIPRVVRAVPELGALTRTTGTITLISGGSAANVVPTEVRAVGNFRIISGSSVTETLNVIKKALRGLDVTVNVIEALEPSKMSRIDGEGWEALNSAITKTWGKGISGEGKSRSKGIAIVPYLMIARSDSRSYSDISDSIYRFSPMIMNEEERQSIHGVNEKIQVYEFKRMIEFYMKLIQGDCIS